MQRRADDELAQRLAMVPAKQLESITLALNAVANHHYDPASLRVLATIFDGAPPLRWPGRCGGVTL